MSNNEPRVIDPKDVTIDSTNIVYETLYYYDNKIANVKQEADSFNGQADKAKQYNDQAHAVYKAIDNITSQYNIPSDATSITIHDTFTITWEDKATPPYHRITQDTYTITGKDNDELQKNYKAWTDDIFKVYDYQMKEIDNNTDKYNQTSNDADSAALALQKLLDDDTLQKIQNLEKQVEYRKFYFPGGTAQLKVADNDLAPLGENWDPRYLSDYIQAAKSKGFHRWLIIPTGKTFSGMRPVSFDEIANVFKSTIDWNTNNFIEDAGTDRETICSMFAGLIYFNKVDAYVADRQVPPNKTRFKHVSEKVDSDVQKAIYSLASLIGQTADDFVKNDVGYYATNDDMAFDAADDLAKLSKYQQQYEEFKKKLWDVLKNAGVLQLCTNENNVTGNNITITQAMQCSQTISELPSGDDTSSTDTSTDPTNSDDTKDKTDDTKDKTDDTKDESDDSNNDAKFKKLFIILVSCLGVIILSLFVAVIILVCKGNKADNQNKNSITSSSLNGGLIVFS